MRERNNGTPTSWNYYVTDHLGNVRQVTEADGSREGNIIQKVNYYPFGAEFCDVNLTQYVATTTGPFGYLLVHNR